jgi:hypothetical protein
MLQNLTRSRQADFAQTVEREIVQRTWGRIHQLHVEVFDDRLHVHGYTPSYYVKQLAIQAVLEKQESFGSPPVDVDIQVGAGDASFGRAETDRGTRKP